MEGLEEAPVPMTHIVFDSQFQTSKITHLSYVKPA
jgi:hypothetical protein